MRARHRLFIFLQSVDCYLQWLTLGLHPERKERSDVTNHKFRLLKPFQFAVQGGDATGAALVFPLPWFHMLTYLIWYLAFCEAEKPLHVCLPAYTVKTRIVKPSKVNSKQVPVAYLLPQRANNSEKLQEIKHVLTFPGPVSLKGWSPDSGHKRYGHFQWPTDQIMKGVLDGQWPILPSSKLMPSEGKHSPHPLTQEWAYLPADRVFHLVFAGHCGFRYLVKLYQHNAENFASSGVYKEGGINSVTWSLQILLDPPGGVSSLPEVTLFSLTLSYDFHFADCKAVRVSHNAVKYAALSLQAGPQPLQEVPPLLNSCSLCVSHSFLCRHTGVDHRMSIAALTMKFFPAA